MSFLASILGGGNKGQSQQQQPQGQQQQGQQGQQPGGPNNGQGQQSDPNASPTSQNQQVNGSNTPPDPSELWNKMWDTTNDGEKAKAPPQLNLDPTVLDQVSGKLDFMQGVNPDLLQKATSGDTKALLDIMQQVARNSYRTSISHSGALTNEFIGQREGFNSQQLPGQIKNHLTENLMSEGSGKAPQFVQSQMRDIAGKIQKANPDATPAQVQQYVQQYIQELTKYANGNQSGESDSQQTSTQDHQGTDWEKWLN